MHNNPLVLFRRRLAASLLFLTLSAIPGLWLGAHALGAHGHTDEAAGVEWSALAQALVHGHEHADGTPEHEHRILPSTYLRPEPPPRDLQAPVLAALQAPVADGLPLANARRRDGLRPPGSSPPPLQLLCTLLI